MAFILPARVFDSIERDCFEHESTETGGVLVGARLGPDLVVIFGIPAGPKAVRSTSGFAPDAAWQQELLNLLHERFSGLAPVDYLADWHRHPSSLDRPSEHDLKTARHIVTDPRWNRVEAVFPIAVLDKRRVRIRAFHAYRYRDGFEELPIEIVPDTDPRVQALLIGESDGRER